MRRLLVLIPLFGALAFPPPRRIGACDHLIQPGHNDACSPRRRHVEGTNIDFSDNQSQLVKEIRHVQFTGTLYNSSDLLNSVP